MQAIDLCRYRSIALIADTHGPVHNDLKESLLQHECIVHAGDIGGLKNLGSATLPLYAVQGNNDTASKWPEDEAADLASLPEILLLAMSGGCLAVIHGHQYPALKTRHNKLRCQFPEAKAILYGHSHRPIIDQSSEPWVLNPGAAGRVRAYDSAGFISLKIYKRGWRLERITRE